MEKVFIGIPVLNRFDLLYRSINALDYSPAELVVINNNAVDMEFKCRLETLATAIGFTALHQENNLGVSASWNLIIRTGLAKGYDWIFIGSNDTVLYPGSLKAAMDFKKERDTVIWHLHAFNVFLIHKHTPDIVGWFDENFYPAYKEDQDYSYRCQLAQVRRVWGIPNSGADHFGSATIRSDPNVAASSKRNRAWRMSYYKSKWGGDAGKEIFRNPFNNPEHDHRWWPSLGESIEWPDKLVRPGLTDAE